LSLFYREIADCFQKLDSDPDCRVVMVTGAGKNFTAGMYFIQSFSNQ